MNPVSDTKKLTQKFTNTIAIIWMETWPTLIPITVVDPVWTGYD